MNPVAPPVVYPRLVRGRPEREDQSRNGVRVVVRRNENGSTVDADCQCFGSLMRMHSNPSCPLRDPRHRAAILAREGSS